MYKGEQMIREIFLRIEKKEELRPSLIQLKAELKEDKTSGSHNREALLFLLKGNFAIFYELLKHEDAKVRKNTALILGELAESESLPYLFAAYQAEKQMFVRNSYLTAICNLDYHSILPDLKECLAELLKENIEGDNKKHIIEEIHILTDMLSPADGSKKHTFCGYEEESEMALLTNRNHIHVTMEELSGIPRKEFNAGVMVKTNQLNKIMQIRTYRELLFVVEGMKSVSADFMEAAEKIAYSDILKFLQKRHLEVAPFYFRIELKSKMDLERRSKFTKRLGMEIEHLTGRKLINSTNNYEIEIRLIEKHDGNFNVMLKLFTLEDDRFLYRKRTTPTAIHPVNAALCLKLSKEYLTEDAQILDPFCGVGTMLIERDKCMPTGTMYGVDIYGDAIRFARENTEEAGLRINYINRNFFDFQHEYLFDELITDMPFLPGGRKDSDLEEIYLKFFIKAKEHMKDQGVMILYTHNFDLLKKCCKSMHYKIEKTFEISMKEGTYVAILRLLRKN